MTENELINLIRQYHVPRNIMAHMKKVAGVCLFIGTKLLKKGENLDLTLLRQAALLHDIVKLCDFENLNLQGIEGFTAEDIQFWSGLIRTCHKDGHITAACNILLDLGEPVIAQIIKKHRYTSVIDKSKDERPDTWEEKILYYADKRVTHDKIVSIKERLDYGRERYFGGHISQEDRLVEAALYKLENEICGKISMSPEEINESGVANFLPGVC
jgi:uncharacterized protein